MRVVGMLSGTSYDGIDAAAADLELGAETITLRPLGLIGTAFPAELRSRIAALLPPNPTTIEEVCRLDTELGQLFGAAAQAAVDGPGAGAVDLVVSHGQTVFHWVSDGHPLGTLQLGAPAWIAARTGLSVVSDLRSADLARGGHGAPLASTLDALLLAGQDRQTGGRRGAVNLGGIANITLVGEPEPVIAYDLGPANALIDAAVVAETGGAQHYDAEGARAARGRVDQAALAALLTEPYYARAAPKPTGKELFHARHVEQTLSAAGVPPPVGDDLLATVTELSAVLVARACAEHGLGELIVSGGGVRNRFLMNRIEDLAAPTAVRLVDELGLPAQAKEAYLFALLGFLTVHGLAGSLPSATGASGPSVLGSITPGARPLRLPEPAVLAPTRLRILG